MSRLDADLIQAYRDSRYLAAGTPVGTVCLVVGEHSPTLECLFVATGRKTAAFLTAVNPHGMALPATGNAARQHALAQRLQAGGWPCYAGAGVGRDPEAWPPEPSWLVLDLPRNEAIALGRSFQQNAIVYAERGLPVELILLR